MLTRLRAHGRERQTDQTEKKQAGDNREEDLDEVNIYPDSFAFLVWAFCILASK